MSPRPAVARPGQHPGCLVFFCGMLLLAASIASVAFSRAAADGDSSAEVGRWIALGIAALALFGIMRGIAALRRGAGESASPDAADVGHVAWKLWLKPVATRRGPGGGIALPLEEGRAAAAIGLGIFSLIWNGIIVGVAVAWWKSNDPVWWLPLIFLGLFGLFGLLLLVGFVQSMIRWLATGETIVELDHEPLSPGDTTGVRIALTGRHTINALRATLECRERVVFRRGTNTVTEYHAVVERELVALAETVGRDDRPIVEVPLVIPRDVPPSFEGSNNSIRWSIRVVVDLPGLPDLDERFALRVLPRAAAEVVADREKLR